MKICLFLILWLLAGSAAFAQSAAQPANPPDPRLARLEAAYNRVQMEQQSVFQQFQMAQEMRRNELLEGQSNVIQRYSATGMDSGSRPLDYDENVRQQQIRQDRLARYDSEISRAYARYLELGEQKKALLDQMLQLTQPAPPARR